MNTRERFRSLVSPSRLRAGLSRVRNNWIYIFQLAIAAGLSYLVGTLIDAGPNEQVPFFAPMAAVIVLSAAGERIRKSVELLVGVSVGVGVGDVIMTWLGSGAWQISAGVLLAVTLAMVLDRGVLAANQAAFAAVLICTILPPETSGGPQRMLDSLIGGLVALLVMAVIPQNPIRRGMREVARVLAMTAEVLGEVSRGLTAADASVVAASLERARGTQAEINTMLATAKTSKEVVLSSPLAFKQRRGLHSLLRLLDSVDNAMRNTRVLARRCLSLDRASERVSPEQIALLRELAELTAELSVVVSEHPDFTMSAERVELTRRLQALARRASEQRIRPEGLNPTMIYGQTRSIIMDLLLVCGLSPESAHAAFGEPPAA